MNGQRKWLAHKENDKKETSFGAVGGVGYDQESDRSIEL
jgi:hypothetical protein